MIRDVNAEQVRLSVTQRDRKGDMRRHVVVLLSAMAGIACTSRILAQEPLDGSWISEGYGLYFEVAGQQLTAYEVTSISCIQSYTATRTVATPRGIGFNVVGRPTTLAVREAGSSDRRRLHVDGAASDIVIRRVGAKPKACAAPPPDTPIVNFDVFTRTWAEQYGFFDLKRADWKSIVASHRGRVTDKTTPDELFEILKSMIEPFEDAQRFLTDGRIYDGPGIPPDVPVPVFPKSDLPAGRDGALEKALELLGGSAGRGANKA